MAYRVRELSADGDVLFDGDVHVIYLKGQAAPWQGYAWAGRDPFGRARFVSMVQTAKVRSAHDAVRSWLGLA